MQYKVSFIVPVYNTKQYLKDCVKTLTGQTYQNIEIVLGDDGSKDGSGSLCDELAASDSRIKVIHKEKGGLVSAWKRGVTESTGDYLNFVDSDDWVDTNMIAEMMEFATGNPKEIIASDYVIERDNGSSEYIWQKLPPGIYDRTAMEREVIPKLLGEEFRYVCMSRCMKLTARKLIEDNCSYSNPQVTMGEDVTVMLPALIDCDRLVIMDHKAYYHYRHLNASMSHNYNKNLYDKIELLRKNIEQIITDKFHGKEQEYMLGRAKMEHIFMLFLALKNEARGNPKGYRKNIAAICKEADTVRLCREHQVELHDKANKLVYLVLRHPNVLTMSLLRLAMIIFYDVLKK